MSQGPSHSGRGERQSGDAEQKPQHTAQTGDGQRNGRARRQGEHGRTGPSGTTGTDGARRMAHGFLGGLSNGSQASSFRTAHRAQMMNPEIAIITTDQTG